MKLQFYLLLAMIAVQLIITKQLFAQNNLRQNIDNYLKQFAIYKSSNTHTYAEDSVISGVLSLLSWDLKSINADSALLYGNKALSIAEKISYTRGEAIAYNQLGAIYRQKGDYFKALDYYNKSISIYKSFEKSNPAYYSSTLRTYLARAVSNLGALYLTMEKPDKAIDMFLEALKIDEAMGNKKGMASKIGNIGNLFYKQKKYEKAIEYYVKAIVIFKEVGDKASLARSYENTGESHRQLSNYEKAKDYYLMAIDIAVAEDNKQLLSDNYGNLGLIYNIEKNYEKAEDLYLKSLRLKTETDDKAGISIVLGNIGSMYMDRNVFAESEKYFLQATAISDSLRDVSTQIDQHTNLCSLYIKKGEYQKASDQYQKVALLKDSLFNEEKIEEITRKEMNYEFDKKEALAKSEYEKQLAITEANKKLAIAEADKKRIIAETEKKVGIAQAETKRITAETDKEKSVTEANKKIDVSNAEKKQSLAEADKKITLSNAAIEKQKLIRNSIIGGTCALALIGFLGFRNFRIKRKKEKTELSLQISETEMKALRAQMNPHFIFNALGSIDSFLLNNQPADANTYLLKYKQLMRLILENSQHKEVSLKEDMQALELYMQLESIRLSYPFTFSFHIDEKIDTEEMTIPPLILQPFVENAIWHGLQHRTIPGGQIDISVQKQNDMLICTVEDNGVGRQINKQSTQYNIKKESLGIKLTEERLKIINELKKVKAYFTVTDLYSSNNTPSGTRVQLSLPAGL